MLPVGLVNPPQDRVHPRVLLALRGLPPSRDFFGNVVEEHIASGFTEQ